MKYTVDYFIQKFQAIPEGKWCTGSWEHLGRHCADGFCGSRSVGSKLVQTEEGVQLAKLLMPLMPNEYESTIIFVINDNHQQSPYRQPTPKQRILAALHDIKAMQHPPYEDITKSLAVMSVNETPDKVCIDSPELYLTSKTMNQ